MILYGNKYFKKPKAFNIIVLDYKGVTYQWLSFSVLHHLILTHLWKNIADVPSDTPVHYLALPVICFIIMFLNHFVDVFSVKSSLGAQTECIKFWYYPVVFLLFLGTQCYSIKAFSSDQVVKSRETSMVYS